MQYTDQLIRQQYLIYEWLSEDVLYIESLALMNEVVSRRQMVDGLLCAVFLFFCFFVCVVECRTHLLSNYFNGRWNGGSDARRRRLWVLFDSQRFGVETDFDVWPAMRFFAVKLAFLLAERVALLAVLFSILRFSHPDANGGCASKSHTIKIIALIRVTSHWAYHCRLQHHLIKFKPSNSRLTKYKWNIKYQK